MSSKTLLVRIPPISEDGEAAARADVARRIEEGFLGLLMSGDEADDHIRVGRAAAGRSPAAAS